MSPWRPQKPCVHPLCGRLGCTEHKRERQVVYDRHRGSARKRGYDSRWEKKRAEYLKLHPVCELQMSGCTKRANTVDHRIPIARGGADDPSNYQSACRCCHSSKTAAEDQGFGNPRRDRKANA